MTKAILNPADDITPVLPVDPTEAEASRMSARWMWPLEAVAAALIAVITVLLLTGVTSRYLFSAPIMWIDEAVSISFIWATMIGSIIAVYRNEHLRLTLFVDMLPQRLRDYVHAFALVATAALLVALVEPAYHYASEEWFITTPALEIPNTFRVAAIAFGFVGMLAVIAIYALRSVSLKALFASVLFVGAVIIACNGFIPTLENLGTLNIAIFLVGFVLVCLAAGVPIAFCFGVGAACYLAFSTTIPLQIVVSRMDEGMSAIVLVSVPIFVFLGCVLDHTGMGKAIVDFLGSLIGHVKAGMSYVLLTSLFIVSGISGSKVSDMATVAPALFPEMKKRGYKSGEMVALLATGAAMADTVPPSIVLIVLGAVAGVSIAGMFQSGIVVAGVLFLALVTLARWKARHENMQGAKRAPFRVIGRLLIVAGPALVLPFLIRSAVGEGVATATEVSTVAVAYALMIGHLMYGGIGIRKLYSILVETAALSGSVLLVLGAASAMAWSITQSGVVQQLSSVLTNLPGGPIAFMGVSILVFLVLGCILEGLPAVLLLAPIMFPIAKQLGINDVQYAMVIVCAMNIGLMLPPIGVGFYIACRIGDAKPDEVIRAIGPYLVALLVGVIIIAAVPSLSTAFLDVK